MLCPNCKTEGPHEGQNFKCPSCGVFHQDGDGNWRAGDSAIRPVDVPVERVDGVDALPHTVPAGGLGERRDSPISAPTDSGGSAIPGRSDADAGVREDGLEIEIMPYPWEK